MNVDLFVGTLTRYYSADWQNGRTRAGEPSPFGSKKNRDSVTDPVELQGVIGGWLEEASFKLKQHLKEPLTWQEGMLPPHFVGELGVAGYGGAILLAAYTNHPHLMRPTTYMKTWDKDPAVETAMKPGAKKDALWEIINCGVWFPVNFAFGIGMKDPSGQPIQAGSIDLLWRGLEYLNETNWGAKPDDIATWRTQAPAETDTFDTQTRFGFATFYEMCRIAREQRLPMKLHY